MKTLETQLSTYASYHRDARNVATHFIGIPLIVLAAAALLSRPTLVWAGWSVSPAWAVAAATGVYYLRLDKALGVLMCALLALAVAFGGWAATLGTSAWLGLGVGMFVVGWVFQFVGHVWEGRKPAFVDDLVGLAIGPLFIVTEALFAFGLLPALRDTVEQRAGELRQSAVLQAR